jgi:hypothetical protein
LQVLVAVVHMKQARMAVPAVVHLARQVQMVYTQEEGGGHKLRVALLPMTQLQAQYHHLLVCYQVPA